jgi:hypothetical protein
MPDPRNPDCFWHKTPMRYAIQLDGLLLLKRILVRPEFHRNECGTA